jgi:hypothetical protein
LIKIDFLKHKETNGNLFPIQIYPKAIQEIIIETLHIKHLFPIDYLGAGILSAASASIGKSHKQVKTWMGRKSKLIYIGVGKPGDAEHKL